MPSKYDESAPVVVDPTDEQRAYAATPLCQLRSQVMFQDWKEKCKPF